MAKRCKSCMYGDHSGHKVNSSCNYSLIKGVCRTILLKDEEMPGDVCPLYERGKGLTARAYKPKTEPRKREIDYLLLEKLYESGMMDVEIAKHAHCSASAVAEWRNKNGLPINKPKRKLETITDKYAELHERGFTDLEISEATGRTLDAVRCWRYRAKLPQNKRAEQL